MKKFIMGLISLACIGVGTCQLYGWPWASIVIGGVVYFDILLSELRP